MKHPKYKYHRITLSIVALLCLLAIACTSSDSESNNRCEECDSIAVAERYETFPMPLIPNEITSQRESMQYALLNFWNRYNFADTTARNTSIGENGFCTFLALLRNVDSVTVDKAMANFLKSGCKHDEACSKCDAFVRKYLDNPESTMRNDNLYLSFLRNRLQSTDNEALQRRIEFKIKLLEKNRVGAVATDFAYIDREGKSGRMHTLDTPLLLLIFADPDCESCKAILPQLMGDRLLQDQRVKVLVVYPDANTEMWKNRISRMPLGWIDAYSPDGEIADRLLYYLPAMPSLYLLDADKRIILKDASHEAVSAAISKRLRLMKQ